MPNTASVKVYRIRPTVNIDDLVASLVKNLHYEPLELNELIQQQQQVKIRAVVKPTTGPPDWVNMIKPYLPRPCAPYRLFQARFRGFYHSKHRECYDLRDLQWFRVSSHRKSD